MFWENLPSLSLWWFFWSASNLEDSKQFENGLSLFQVEGVWNSGERRWKYKMIGFLTSTHAEMYRAQRFQCPWAANQPWLQLAGHGAERAAASKPSSVFKNTNPFHCLWTKLLTDMLNLLNMYFANFEMRKTLCKNFYRCWMIVNVVKDVGLCSFVDRY